MFLGSRFPRRLRLAGLASKTYEKPLKLRWPSSFFVARQYHACENVEISNIEGVYQGRNGPVTSQCTNVNPTMSGKQNPLSCTLK